MVFFPWDAGNDDEEGGERRCGGHCMVPACAPLGEHTSAKHVKKNRAFQLNAS
jgi:hypothetical protein